MKGLSNETCELLGIGAVSEMAQELAQLYGPGSLYRIMHIHSAEPRKELGYWNDRITKKGSVLTDENVAFFAPGSFRHTQITHLSLWLTERCVRIHPVQPIIVITLWDALSVKWRPHGQYTEDDGSYCPEVPGIDLTFKVLRDG